jgi:hypothetical protein
MRQRRAAESTNAALVLPIVGFIGDHSNLITQTRLPCFEEQGVDENLAKEARKAVAG